MPEKPPYWQDHRRHTPLKRSVLTVSMREGRRVRMVLRAMRVRSTYARHRIRHGIRHTAVRAGRRPCPSVANDRLRHMFQPDRLRPARHLCSQARRTFSTTANSKLVRRSSSAPTLRCQTTRCVRIPRSADGGAILFEHGGEDPQPGPPGQFNSSALVSTSRSTRGRWRTGDPAWETREAMQDCVFMAAPSVRPWPRV